MALVYIGLGSNLGEREHNIREAIRRIENHSIKLLKLSTIIESDPVGGPVQGKYLNAVAGFQTELPAELLLSCLLEVEKSLGRIRDEKNGPRTIDLDILLYDNLTINLPHLKIPHPRMFQRDFVMGPLKEITAQKK